MYSIHVEIEKELSLNKRSHDAAVICPELYSAMEKFPSVPRYVELSFVCNIPQNVSVVSLSLVMFVVLLLLFDIDDVVDVVVKQCSQVLTQSYSMTPTIFEKALFNFFKYSVTLAEVSLTRPSNIKSILSRS